MAKKVKTIKDVEKEELGNPEELKKDEPKQEELAGMPEKVALVDGKPAKTPMELQAVKMLEIFEDLKTISDTLGDERNKLLEFMKKAGREVLNLKDKEGNNYEVKITTTAEKISIKQKKEEML